MKKLRGFTLGVFVRLRACIFITKKKNGHRLLDDDIYARFVYLCHTVEDIHSDKSFSVFVCVSGTNDYPLIFKR